MNGDVNLSKDNQTNNLINMKRNRQKSRMTERQRDKQSAKNMTDNVIPETAFYRAIVQTTIYK